MRTTIRVALAIALAALGTPAAAQTTPPASPRCTADEYRQFDFWIGEWEVHTADGRVAGHNSITKVLDGCALHENWRSAGGGSGFSYNAWDRSRQRWHQTWVDASGGLLLLDGGLNAAGAMVMTGETLNAQRQTVRQRITWSRLEDGRVRQLWEASSDGGKTWTVSFDGTYRKRN